MKAAAADPDAAITCAKRLLDLRAAIDEAEDALEWPQLVKEANELLPEARAVVATRGDATHQAEAAAAERALHEAVMTHDAGLLRQRMEDLRRVGRQALARSGELDLIAFDHFRSLVSEMTDQEAARRLISAGERAAADRDFDTLHAINIELNSLLPRPIPPPDNPFSSGVREA